MEFFWPFIYSAALAVIVGGCVMYVANLFIRKIRTVRPLIILYVVKIALFVFVFIAGLIALSPIILGALAGLSLADVCNKKGYFNKIVTEWLKW
jgi:hypothetical protein